MWCLISFIFGYFIVYVTITQSDHKAGPSKLQFDTFYIFKKIGLTKLFGKIWGDTNGK